MDSGEVTSTLVVVANFLSLTTLVTMQGGVAAIDLFFPAAGTALTGILHSCSHRWDGIGRSLPSFPCSEIVSMILLLFERLIEK